MIRRSWSHVFSGTSAIRSFSRPFQTRETYLRLSSPIVELSRAMIAIGTFTASVMAERRTCFTKTFNRLKPISQSAVTAWLSHFHST
jgi:hypothetical protein